MGKILSNFDLEIIARSCSTVGLEVGDDIADSQGFGYLCISEAALIVAAVVWIDSVCYESWYLSPSVCTVKGRQLFWDAARSTTVETAKWWPRFTSCVCVHIICTHFFNSSLKYLDHFYMCSMLTSICFIQVYFWRTFIWPFCGAWEKKQICKHPVNIHMHVHQPYHSDRLRSHGSR